MQFWYILRQCFFLLYIIFIVLLKIFFKFKKMRTCVGLLYRFLPLCVELQMELVFFSLELSLLGLRMYVKVLWQYGRKITFYVQCLKEGKNLDFHVLTLRHSHHIFQVVDSRFGIFQCYINRIGTHTRWDELWFFLVVSTITFSSCEFV